uniref:Uncharacterized protein n=1 Tax=Glossina palpalis gambiensis TaxID=67801 RepID=A0A1B0AWT2_9MUSC
MSFLLTLSMLAFFSQMPNLINIPNESILMKLHQSTVYSLLRVSDTIITLYSKKLQENIFLSAYYRFHMTGTSKTILVSINFLLFNEPFENEQQIFSDFHMNTHTHTYRHCIALPL